MAITAKVPCGSHPADGDNDHNKMTKKGKGQKICSASNDSEEGANVAPQNSKRLVGTDLNNNAGKNDRDTAKKSPDKEKSGQKNLSASDEGDMAAKGSTIVIRIFPVLPKKEAAERSAAPATRVL